MEASSEDTFTMQNSYSESEQSGAVNTFIKQSNEIQAEIQRLSQLCQSISPKNNEYYGTWEDSDSEEESSPEMQWSQINEMLSKYSFEQIVLIEDSNSGVVPHLPSLINVMWDLLGEYAAKVKDIEELSSKKTDSHKHKGKLKKLAELCKEKDQVIETLTGKKPSLSTSEKEINTFRAFWNRNPGENDKKALELIAYYESKGSSKDNNPKLEEYERQLEHIRKELSAENFEKIPEVIKKMQQVMGSLPSIERFIEAVCLTVGNDKFDLDRTLEEIQKWRESSGVFERALESLYNNIEATGQAAIDRAAAIAHFCNLFEVSTAPVRVVVDQVYYFVHEIKIFLSVRFI